MTNLIEYLIDLHRQSLKGRLDEIDQWYFMKSPLIPFTFCFIYLTFVLYLGPRMMAKRKPFELKNVLMVYNLSQVLVCCYMVSFLFRVENSIKLMLSLGCVFKEGVHTPEMILFFEIGWWYIVTKHIDLLDTVFFVLRKKQDHVSFLHVYHHATMALSTWIIHKYMPTEEAAFVGCINTFVHIVMYTYYFVAALGPRFRRFLWWKPYLTKLQLLQFLIILAYFGTIAVFGCRKQYKVPPAVVVFLALQAAIFFILFMDFYRKAYLIKKDKRLEENNNKAVDEKNGKLPTNHIVNSVLKTKENGDKMKSL